MANDATNKSTSNCDSTENNSLSNAGDQQKVPPLRIVLNIAGNQKSSSTTTGNQQSSTKRDKTQDTRQESSLKAGGRVRIKLGTNRQQSGKGEAESNDSSNRLENQRAKERTNDKQLENINEDSTSSFTHLRRITRRSQRTVQSISNEDEESISSMTSIDENLNTTNNTHQNSDTAHDPDQSNSASTTAASSATNIATNGSSNTDTPRRYKRKKVESSESPSFECDNFLGQQNYKLPNQNSFELFKNIRKQVDKKLKSLSCVNPKLPYGFRDYMLSRGSYLLDGNKLGNGTNLFMNEHGGLNLAPVGKYHLIRHSRVNYSVPDRAKVPLGLPVNSPLYDLFIEQEKERYRMRIQHIKEREKLTLAAEQEFMRVYNQAALAAANQTEPFSVCTMLKHQEMYNYLDTDGTTILSREDAQQDQVNQPDGVRTRRRQHGQISPAPARKSSNVEESGISSDIAKKEADSSNSSLSEKKSDANQSKTMDPPERDENRVERVNEHNQTIPETTENISEKTNINSTNELSKMDAPNNIRISEDSSKTREISETDEKSEVKMETSGFKTDEKSVASESLHLEQNNSDSQRSNERLKSSPNDETDETVTGTDGGNKSSENAVKVTDEEQKTINREKFLVHLQEIDDKWDKIRHEMLIRHKNEAESLHAIQKLEWEWKTKEIGACDVRTTLFIDNTLVPKLDIFSQDY